MALLNFLRNKKQPENKFVGRHEQVINAYLLLGEEIPESEIQKARGKDITERAEILSELERNEENSVSDLKVNYAPSSLDVHTRTLDIMHKSYGKCILQHAPDLENRCLKLVEQARIRILELIDSEQEEDVIKSLSKMENLAHGSRYLSIFSLGELLAKEEGEPTGNLDTTDVQKAWFIRCLLSQPKSLVMFFKIVPPEINDFKTYKNEIEKLSEKLLAENKINNAQLSEINSTLDYLLEMVENNS